MNGIYTLNSDSKTVHIYGFCYHSVRASTFHYEEDALKAAGVKARFCKICAKRRDEELKLIVEQRIKEEKERKGRKK